MSRNRYRLRVENLESRICMSFGGLDAVFGDSGVVQLDNIQTADSYDQAHALVALADNSVVVSGTSEVGRGRVSSFVKLDETGQPDPTFGDNGQVLLPFELADTSVITTDDGSLYIGGNRFVEGGVQFVIMKLTGGGALDSTFAGLGFRTFAPNSQMLAVGDSVAVLSQNDAQVAPLEYRITKLDSSGELDGSFGVLGVTGVFNPFSPLPDPGAAVGSPQIVVDDADRLYVAGQVYSQSDDADYLRMVRFDSAGALDSTFGDQGVMQQAIEVEPHWVIAAEQGSGGTTLVVWKTADEDATTVYAQRILVDGTKDDTFGDSGLLQSSDLPRAFNRSYEDTPLVVSLGPRRTMVVVSIEDFFRFFHYYSLVIGSDGQFDTTHGDAGVGESTSQNFKHLDAVAPAILPNGKLRVAAWGYDTSPIPPVDWYLFGLDGEGSTDAAFGSGGIASVDFTRPSSYVDFFDVQPTSSSLAAVQSPPLQPVSPERPGIGATDVTVIRRNGDLNTGHESGGEFSLGSVVSDQYFNWLPVRTGGFLTATVNSVSAQGAFPWVLNLEKRLPSGAIDPSFGTGGTLSISTHDAQSGLQPTLRQLSDGTIYVGLQTTGDNNQAWIAKVTESGQLMTGFGDEGVFWFGDGASNLIDFAVANDGSVYLLQAGQTGGATPQLNVVALDGNGHIDTSFADQGTYSSDLMTEYDLLRIVQDDAGRLLVLLRADTELQVRRLTNAGQDDIGFGTDGTVVVSDLIVSEETHADICVFANQPIVGATTGLFTTDTTVFALNDDGTPDTRFGQSGSSTFSFGEHGESVQSISVLPDASVILGVRTQDALNSFGVIAKLEGLDPSPVPLHNVYYPLNVNAPLDGVLSARDALFVIFYLNHPDDIPAGAGPEEVGYVDVNGDGFVSPIDALLVIHALNHGEGEASADAEGESGATVAHAALDRYWAYFALPGSGSDDNVEGESGGEAREAYWWLNTPASSP